MVSLGAYVRDEVNILFEEANKYDETRPHPGPLATPDYQKALELYQKALHQMKSDDDRRSFAYYQIAQLYAYSNPNLNKKPEHLKAIEYYKKVIEANLWWDPIHYRSIRYCGNQYYTLQKFEELLGVAKKAFEYNIDDIEERWIKEATERPYDPPSFKSTRTSIMKHQETNIRNIVAASGAIDRSGTLTIAELNKIIKANLAPEITEITQDWLKTKLDHITNTEALIDLELDNNLSISANTAEQVLIQEESSLKTEQTLLPENTKPVESSATAGKNNDENSTKNRRIEPVAISIVTLIALTVLVSAWAMTRRKSKK